MNLATSLRWALVLAILLVAANPSLVLAQGEQTFTGATDSDYLNEFNWVGVSGMLVPDGSFDEFAAIGSNTPDPLNPGNTFPVVTADLTSPGAPSVGRLLIGFGAGADGTLNVSGNGSITAEATFGGLAGDIVVGANGTGALNISTTGSAMADLLDFRTTGTVRITGPDATIGSSGGFLMAGTLIADITNPNSHSVINVAGATTLGGALGVDLSGIPAPAVGASWDIIETASISGAFSSVNLVGGSLGAGQGLATRNVPSGGNTVVQLFVNQLLTLRVDRETGTMEMSNEGATGVPIVGYTIASTAGSLDHSDGSWNSLADQGMPGWRESNASENRLTELKEFGDTSVTSGSPLDLGDAFNPAPTAFGEDVEDLVFEYVGPDGSLVTGLVDFEGHGVNTLALTVDPESGEAQFTNESTFDTAIVGYTITSDSSALDIDGWNSLDDQGISGGDWRESNPSADRMTELLEFGSLPLGSGDSFGLSALFDPSLGGDLTFEFLIEGDTTPTPGVVFFDSFATNPADFNNDGTVDGDDFLIWQSGFNNDASGDANGDGVTDGDDFLIWQANFGLAAGAASGAVPEPASVMLLILTSGLFCARRTGSRSK